MTIRTKEGVLIQKSIGCKGCIYAQKGGILNGRLECHRFPRSWAGAPAVSYFPTVHPDDWCGELIPKN